jgi:hypothetical protein
MGLSPRARNFEANVVYIMRATADNGARKLMDTRVLRGGLAVDRSHVVAFEPAIDLDGSEGDSPPPLPAFFGEAALNAAGEKLYELALLFGDEPPEGEWAIWHEQAPVLSSATWLSQGRPASTNLSLLRSGPPPSMLRVEWANAAHAADWPVNVTTADALPAPEELQGLSLAALLDLLSSARPLHEALRAWLRRQPDDDDSDVEQATELIDPHAKVDTSGFLVKRVQRACWAMRSLRARLEQPVLSASAMAWRIKGPVGAYAMLEAMCRQCDATLPDEWAFLLCELWREMAQVRLQAGGGCAPAPEIQVMMTAFLDDLQGRLTLALPSCSGAMRAYVDDALKETTNATT